jgi:hypothetical protein
MGIYRISIGESKAGTEGGGGFAPWRDAASPSHGMAFARTVLILSKSASLEYKSDASRLRRSLGEEARVEAGPVWIAVGDAGESDEMADFKLA